MTVTLLVLGKDSAYWNEQVVLISEVYPPFPKRFRCRRENGELMDFYAWELELLAVDTALVGREG